MYKRKKICVVTGTRAEYGLLYWFMKKILSDKDLKLQIVVTGMHLSSEFGLTYQQIIKDGFNIDEKIEVLLSSDSSIGISKSIGLGVISFSEVLERLKPDIIVLLGDRFDILGAAIAATIARIPIAHIHGGEATEGLIDEPIRHSISKMSHLHFTSTEEYRKRVIQLGESPERVFNYGAIGIDNIKKLKLLKRKEFEKAIQFKLNKKNLLVTFHPVTLEKSTAEKQFIQLLSAIDTLKDTNILFTHPNSDTDGRIIIQLIKEYVKKNSRKSISFVSMGQMKYLSALQFVDGVVGNSSSGIVEVPSFKKGTINIGERQRGRVKSESVIDCDANVNSILIAIEKLYSINFQKMLITVKNPYGEGGASIKIKNCIKYFNLEGILKKKFYDIKL